MKHKFIKSDDAETEAIKPVRTNRQPYRHGDTQVFDHGNKHLVREVAYIGGSGNDILNGDEGRDVLQGDDGIDLLGGGAGADVILGGAQDDTLYGDAHFRQSVPWDGITYNLISGSLTTESFPMVQDVAVADAGADQLYGGAVGLRQPELLRLVRKTNAAYRHQADRHENENQLKEAA